MTANPTTPARLMQIAWGFAPGLIVETAVKAGIFDSLLDQPLTIEEAARKLKVSNRGLAALMNALVGLQLLAKDKEQRFQLTNESRLFLVSSSPASLARFFKQISTHLMPSWLDMSAALRSGEPYQTFDREEDGGRFFADFVESLFAVNFPAANALAAHLGIARTERPMRVLDIATGSGVWGIALARQSPRVTVTAVDWPAVIPIATKSVRQHGLEAQFKFEAGDILETNFGTGQDVAILGHILHSEGEERARLLLKRVHDALVPGGTVAVAEFLVDEDRSGPVLGLLFSVTMFLNTEHGQTWSFQELRSLLEQAGFLDVATLDAPGFSPLILARRSH